MEERTKERCQLDYSIVEILLGSCGSPHSFGGDSFSHRRYGIYRSFGLPLRVSYPSAEQLKLQIERRRSCSQMNFKRKKILLPGRQAPATCNEMRLRLLKILLQTMIPLHTQINSLRLGFFPSLREWLAQGLNGKCPYVRPPGNSRASWRGYDGFH